MLLRARRVIKLSRNMIANVLKVHSTYMYCKIDEAHMSFVYFSVWSTAAVVIFKMKLKINLRNNTFLLCGWVSCLFLAITASYYSSLDKKKSLDFERWFSRYANLPNLEDWRHTIFLHLIQFSFYKYSPKLNEKKINWINSPDWTT